MDTKGDSPRGDYSASRPPSWNTLEGHYLVTEQFTFPNYSINNQAINNFRNFRNYRSPSFSADPHFTRLGQSKSIEKCIYDAHVHNVITSLVAAAKEDFIWNRMQ